MAYTVALVAKCPAGTCMPFRAMGQSVAYQPQVSSGIGGPSSTSRPTPSAPPAPPPAGGGGSKTAATVGAVIGVLAAVGVAGGLFFWYKRRAVTGVSAYSSSSSSSGGGGGLLASFGMSDSSPASAVMLNAAGAQEEVDLGAAYSAL